MPTPSPAPCLNGGEEYSASHDAALRRDPSHYPSHPFVVVFHAAVGRKSLFMSGRWPTTSSVRIVPLRAASSTTLRWKRSKGLKLAGCALYQLRSADMPPSKSGPPWRPGAAASGRDRAFEHRLFTMLRVAAAGRTGSGGSWTDLASPACFAL